MRKADAPGGIFLNAIDEALTVDVRRDAVEDQISDRIGKKVQLAVAVEIGNLIVDVFGRFLVVIERSGIEIGYSESREIRCLPRIVGNLIRAVRNTADVCEAAGGVEHR